MSDMKEKLENRMRDSKEYCDLKKDIAIHELKSDINIKLIDLLELIYSDNYDFINNNFDRSIDEIIYDFINLEMRVKK